MTAHCDRCDVVTLAGATGKHRSHVVDGDGTAETFGGRLEPVADLAIEIGEGEPANAALRSAADFGGLHQVAPEALGIDAEVGQRRAWHGGGYRKGPNNLCRAA
jgi:hypothetical protein